MRKSLILMVLVSFALLLTFSLTGCGKKTPPTDDPNKSTSTDTPPVDPNTSEVAPMPIIDNNPPVIEPAPSAKPDPNDPAVTVNGKVITVGQIEETMQPQIEGNPMMDPNNPQAPQYRQLLYDNTLQTLIIETLLEAKVADANITVTDDEIAAELLSLAQSRGMTIEQFRAFAEQVGQSYENMKEQAGKLLIYMKLAKADNSDAADVTDEEALKFYEENKDRMGTPEQVRASHILIKVEPADSEAVKAEKRAKAEELLKQIKDGGDFAELARTHSDCPSAKDGGDLDYFGKGAMVPAFDQAAFSLEVGQLSDIVETNFGYHIIKVTDRKDGSTPPFEEVKDRIVERLQTGKERDILKAYIDKLKADANIVYPVGKEPKQPAMPPLQ